MYQIEPITLVDRTKAFINELNDSKKYHLREMIDTDILYRCSDGELLDSPTQVLDLYARFDKYYDRAIWRAERITRVDAHTAFLSVVFQGVDRETKEKIEWRSIQRIAFNALGKITAIESDKLLAA